MMRCSRVESLFSACWEDELSVAEREALEAHFGACPACRGAYDIFVRGMEAVQSLPRLEVEPGFAAAVLARARAAERAPAARGTAPVRIGSWAWGWRPALAAAALVAAIGVGVYSLRPPGPVPGESPTAKSAAERVAAVTPPAAAPAARAKAQGPVAMPPAAAQRAKSPRSLALGGGAAQAALAARSADEAAVVPDSLFDHAYDLEFALDPVHLRRTPGEQKLRPARLVPAAEDGRKASITF
jgi:anti-sigma factor RsiW